MNDQNNKRREFIKKAAYIAPAVATLSAMPSIAQSGSGGSASTPSFSNNQQRPRPTHSNRPSGAIHNTNSRRPHR